MSCYAQVEKGGAWTDRGRRIRVPLSVEISFVPVL